MLFQHRHSISLLQCKSLMDSTLGFPTASNLWTAQGSDTKIRLLVLPVDYKSLEISRSAGLDLDLALSGERLP